MTTTSRLSGANVEALGWFGLYAPGRTSPDIVGNLETKVRAVAQLPEVQARMQALGYQLAATTAAELKLIQRAEFDRWDGIVKASGFKPE